MKTISWFVILIFLITGCNTKNNGNHKTVRLTTEKLIPIAGNYLKNPESGLQINKINIPLDTTTGFNLWEYEAHYGTYIDNGMLATYFVGDKDPVVLASFPHPGEQFDFEGNLMSTIHSFCRVEPELKILQIYFLLEIIENEGISYQSVNLELTESGQTEKENITIDSTTFIQKFNYLRANWHKIPEKAIYHDP